MMPIEVHPHHADPSIIIFEMEGEWGWEEFDRSVDEAVALAGQVPGRVDLVGNLLKSGPVPHGAIQKVRMAINKMPATWGCTVVVQNNLFIKLIAETFGRIYPAYADRFPIVDSVAEARALIDRLRRE